MNHRLDVLAPSATDDSDALAHLLLGTQHRLHPLPDLADLATAAIALARGSRHKVLLPVGAQPVEFALVRQGAELWVSVYRTDAMLDVVLLDRAVDLPTLLRLCATSLERRLPSAAPEAVPAMRQLMQLASSTHVQPGHHRSAVAVRRTGGAVDAPAEPTPLAFGYSVAIYPAVGSAPHGGSSPSDTHALLFSGSLWAFLRGRRIALCAGPVMPAVQRMLEVVRLVVDAAESGRPCQVRQRVGNFQVSARLAGTGLRRGRTARGTTPLLRVEPAHDADAFRIPEQIEAWYIAQPPALQNPTEADEASGVARPPVSTGAARHASLHVELTLSGPQRDSLSLRGLDLVAMARPVLRLASELLRTLTEVDRGQMRNLRVRALREEVRQLRRRVQTKPPSPSFVNRDPERLRLHALPQPAAREGLRLAASTPDPRPSPDKYHEKWCVTVDALDVEGTFLCGPSLIATTPRQAIAISLADGEPRWCVAGSGSYQLVGQVLLHVPVDGKAALWDARLGEAFAETGVRPRADCLPLALPAGGGAIPPMAVLHEHAQQLVAIDLRNGEPRWRFAAPTAGLLRFGIAGRVLVVASESAAHALDIATGEVAWRHAEEAHLAPGFALCGDVVVLASRDSGAAHSRLSGIDLYSGSLRWQRQLDAAIHRAPCNLGDLALLGLTSRQVRRPQAASDAGNRAPHSLAAFLPSDGTLRWMIPDPGDADSACMVAAEQLVVHRSDGQLLALSLESGQTLWQQQLSTGQAELPRRLQPQLRGEQLFVPSRRLHCIGAKSGHSLGHPTPPERVPDRFFLDDRGWLVVAEESGHISAHAPAPSLTLVKGGRLG